MSKIESNQISQNWKEDALAKKYNSDIEQLGLSVATRKFADSFNLKPEYVKKGAENFVEMRNHLNTDPGIMIANHPGDFDVIYMLMALDRKDIRFMVGKEVFEMWSKVFGEEHVVCAETHNNREDEKEAPYRNIKIIRSILSHIEQGGLFVFFPTGGDDQRAEPYFKFKELFRVLIKKMRPEDMVYAMNIKSMKKEEELDKSIRFAGSLSSLSTKGFLNVSKLLKPLVREIDESFSQASEWQGVADGEKNNKAVSLKLTEHYLEKFPNFREIVHKNREIYSDL